MGPSDVHTLELAIDNLVLVPLKNGKYILFTHLFMYNHVTKLLPKICPDSNSASNFACGRTKYTQIITMP